MHNGRTRIVILGGGFAGVRVAKHLAASGKSGCEIVLVSAKSAQTFTPWLHDIATHIIVSEEVLSEHIVHPSADIPLTTVFHGRAAGVRFRRAEVVGLDQTHQHVILKDGVTLGYDTLVIALGSESAYFGISGLPQFAFSLKSEAEAEAIQQSLGGLLYSVMRGERIGADVRICGAGPSGVETAAELAVLRNTLVAQGLLNAGSFRVTLLDAAPRVLGMASPKVSKLTLQRLRDLGVEVLLDTMLAAATETKITVRPRPRAANETAISMSPFTGETDLPTDCTIWTGGIQPNSVLQQFALPKDARGRICITPTFHVDGQQNIFAVGDAAILLNPATKQPLPQTAQAAEHAAAFVAENVLRSRQGRPLIEYVFPKYWPFVVSVGGTYGIAEFDAIVLAGRLGYVFRRLADLRYFVRTLPFMMALCTWHRGFYK